MKKFLIIFITSVVTFSALAFLGVKKYKKYTRKYIVLPRKQLED